MEGQEWNHGFVGIDKGQPVPKHDREKNYFKSPEFVKGELERASELPVSARWRRAMDWFVGKGFFTRQVSLAVEIARTCHNHLEAMWFVWIAEQHGSRYSELLSDSIRNAAFGSDPLIRPVALYLSAMCDTSAPALRSLRDMMIRSASTGYLPAQCDYAAHLVIGGDGTAENLIIAAAGRDEPRGLYMLGMQLADDGGNGSPRRFDLIPYDEAQGIRSVEKAASFGFLPAYVMMCSFCMKSGDYVGMAQWSLKLVPYTFKHVSNHILALCDKPTFQAPTVIPALYLLGKVVRGRVDVDSKSVFDKRHFARFFDAIRWVEVTGISWDEFVRDGCIAWVACAKRIGVHKDIRRMIAKMVWKSREEGWPIEFHRYSRYNGRYVIYDFDTTAEPA